MGLSERTLQRWRRDGAISGDARTREHRADGAVRSPANRLSQAELVATGPNQVWRLGLTDLASTVMFFYLYLTP